jgi:hypothetical protein
MFFEPRADEIFLFQLLEGRAVAVTCGQSRLARSAVEVADAGTECLRRKTVFISIVALRKAGAFGAAGGRNKKSRR